MNPDSVPRAYAPDENSAQPLLKESAPRSLPNQYAELKRLIKQRGLLDRQPAYYAAKTVFTIHEARAAGMTDISVEVLFPDERAAPNDGERWDVSRPINEVLNEKEPPK